MPESNENEKQVPEEPIEKERPPYRKAWPPPEEEPIETPEPEPPQDSDDN